MSKIMFFKSILKDIKEDLKEIFTMDLEKEEYYTLIKEEEKKLEKYIYDDKYRKKIFKEVVLDAFKEYIREKFTTNI
jgi:5'-deoxynucleotidase YfbR-like HD superfamily hydrolase